MNKEEIPVITDREKLYDKCENMEQLFDKYYLPLLDKHYSKTYELQQENKQLREKLDKNTEIYLNASKYGSKMEGKVVVLEYILEELKKWLEEQNYKDENGWFIDVMEVLDKIKELEEGVKVENKRN